MVTVDICTKDRYFDTLPLCLMSVANQTIVPDEVYIYDDSENRIDLREHLLYQHIFNIFNQKGIKVDIIYGFKQGQHIGHQIIQDKAKDLIWRIDDDCFAEPNVLEILLQNISYSVGAVGGLVLMPDAKWKECQPNKINDLSDNCQWHKWNGKKSVEHLYSSYLYEKGHNYERHLSPVAHREETLHSYSIYQNHELVVDSRAVTWHLRSNTGGIRTGKPEDWHNDEITFQEKMREYHGIKVCFLDCGKGDAVCFKSILPQIKEKYKKVIIASLYPDLFKGEEVITLEEGAKLVNPHKHNIYRFMTERNWNDNLVKAYEALYLNS